MPHLRSIALRRPSDQAAEAFPFSVPVIRSLTTMDLDADVTFLVGENGSGKSTLLEGIAAAAGLPTVGSESIDRDETLAAQRAFAKVLRLTWNTRVRRGFYLLDEPEAPLSPQSQLALMAMIFDMVKQDAQFVIATHSPILVGFPGARIYSCDRVPLERVPFEELDHVVITRDFLNAPERYLRHLRSE